MEKVVFYGPKDVRIERLSEIPSCEDGGLLVRVEAAAICGSDIKAYNVGNPKLRIGCTMGHEFVGRVAKASKPTGFSEGDRVTMATTIGCGSCYYCRLGKSNLCTSAKAMGFAYDGAMADYIVVPKTAVDRGNVVLVPEEIPPETAALAEPMSCVINGLSRVPVRDVHYALVIGMGALGLFHAIALRDRGVEHIVCCEFPGVKKELAESLGFFTVTPDELQADYLKMAEELGFDLVVITAPNSRIQSVAPQYARKSGYISYFASLPAGGDAINLSSRLIHYNELILFGTSDSTPAHVAEALDLIRAQSDSIRKAVALLPLRQAVEGIQGVLSMKYAKVVLVPGG